MPEHTYPVNHRITEGLTARTITILLIPIEQRTCSIDGGRHIPYQQTWDAFNFSRAWVDGLRDPCQYLHVPLRHTDPPDETVHRLYPIWDQGDVIGLKTPHYRPYHADGNWVWDRFTLVARHTLGGSKEKVQVPGTILPVWHAQSAKAMPNWAVRLRKTVQRVAAYPVKSISDPDIRAAGYPPGEALYHCGVASPREWLTQVWNQEQKIPYETNPWIWIVEIQ